MIQVETIEIAKLELQPGDLLLVRVPPNWTHEQQLNAHSAVEAAMKSAGAYAPIIIGTTDVDFQIVRKDAA